MSKRERTSADQEHALRLLLPKILELENHDDRKTILVGDLNMNPFEPGMVNADLLHSVMARIDAQGNRTVQGDNYPKFYNPMWGLLGDRGGRPPGTHRYTGDGVSRLFWHMFDQFLLRPAVLPFFIEDKLEVIDRDEDVPFINENGNLPETGSDHLPIVASFNIQI